MVNNNRELVSFFVDKMLKSLQKRTSNKAAQYKIIAVIMEGIVAKALDGAHPYEISKQMKDALVELKTSDELNQFIRDIEEDEIKIAIKGASTLFEG